MSNVQATDPEVWVDRHGDGLYRYALPRLRSPDLAADAVQETFLEAPRARGSFSGRSSERTWLVGILRHKILDHYRRTAGDRAAVAIGAAAGCSSDDPAFDPRGRWRSHPASWAGDPACAMETQEFWDVFGLCLAQLPRGVADAFSERLTDCVPTRSATSWGSPRQTFGPASTAGARCCASAWSGGGSTAPGDDPHRA